MSAPDAESLPPRPGTSGKGGTPSEIREWAASVSGKPANPPPEDAGIPSPAVPPRVENGIGSTALSRLVAKPRAPGGAMLTGFSCESGTHIGVWDKPCGLRTANADGLAGRRTARGQQPFQTLVGGGFAKPDDERVDF